MALEPNAAALRRKLEEIGLQLKCPICGTGRVSVEPFVAIQGVTFDESGQPAMDPTTGPALLPVYCSYCGYAMFFGAAQLGIRP